MDNTAEPVTAPPGDDDEHPAADDRSAGEAPLSPPAPGMETSGAQPYAPPGYGYAPFPPYGAHYGPPPGQMPPPPYGWAGWPPPAPPPPQGGREFWRNAVVAWIVAGVLGLCVIGLSVALATQGPPDGVRVLTPAGQSAPGAGPPFAGSGLFRGLGVAGTVASVSSGSFTVIDRTGATVTVNEQSSTAYYNGTTNASSSIVVSGARVLVQGSRSGNVVTATRVIVLPSGGFGSVFSG